MTAKGKAKPCKHQQFFWNGNEHECSECGKIARTIWVKKSKEATR